jgi:hypothetical protein
MKKMGVRSLADLVRAAEALRAASADEIGAARARCMSLALGGIGFTEGPSRARRLDGALV